MPTIALHVQQDGAYRQWQSLVGGTFGYQCVDDSDGTSHDSDATYLLLRNVGPNTGIISFPVFLQAEGLIPTSITINVAAKRNAVSNPDFSIGFQRGGTFGFDAVTFMPGASYTVQSRTFTTNPLTAAAWTAADLVGLEMCLSTTPGFAAANRITLLSGSLTYYGNTNARRDYPASLGE